MENSTTVVAAVVCQSLIISCVPLSKFHIPCSALPCKDKVEEKHTRAILISQNKGKVQSEHLPILMELQTGLRTRTAASRAYQGFPATTAVLPVCQKKQRQKTILALSHTLNWLPGAFPYLAH